MDNKELIKKVEFQVTDRWDREDGGVEIYASISKDATENYFKDAGITPKNDNGDEDLSYVEGEVQYMFDADGNLGEGLLFPVYEQDGEFINGDFIEAPGDFWDLADEIKKELA